MADVDMKEEEVVEKVEDHQPTCCGPNSSYVKLVSADGHIFILRRRVIKCSNTLMTMIKNSMSLAENENGENKVDLQEIKSTPLFWVCRYLTFNDRHQETWFNVPDFQMEEDYASEILCAACFLEI